MIGAFQPVTSAVGWKKVAGAFSALQEVATGYAQLTEFLTLDGTPHQTTFGHFGFLPQGHVGGSEPTLRFRRVIWQARPVLNAQLQNVQQGFREPMGAQQQATPTPKRYTMERPRRQLLGVVYTEFPPGTQQQ